MDGNIYFCRIHVYIIFVYRFKTGGFMDFSNIIYSGVVMYIGMYNTFLKFTGQNI